MAAMSNLLSVNTQNLWHEVSSKKMRSRFRKTKSWDFQPLPTPKIWNFDILRPDYEIFKILPN